MRQPALAASFVMLFVMLAPALTASPTRTTATNAAETTQAGANPGAPVAPCSACHADVAAAFRATSHAQALVTNSSIDASCAACHGNGTAHMANPAKPGLILKFAEANLDTINNSCKGCHADTHPPGPNAHNRAGVSCTNCHAVHSPASDSLTGKLQQSGTSKRLPMEFANVDAGSAICFDCHQDTFSQFQFNERHRLAVGAITCADCHDPHATGGGARLGAFNDAACGECHMDASGPFIFEHSASKVDGCTACHEPHGSPNRHLLTHQQTGELCYSCHAMVPQFHLGFSPAGGPRFDESSQCTNCHVAVHGSNLDRNLLR